MIIIAFGNIELTQTCEMYTDGECYSDNFR